MTYDCEDVEEAQLLKARIVTAMSRKSNRTTVRSFPTARFAEIAGACRSKKKAEKEPT